MQHEPFDRDLMKSDRVDELIDLLTPAIHGLIERIDAEEFTTNQFIEVMLTDPASKSAYDTALARWGEGEARGKMVIHGQVIPAILRLSPLIEWSGYAHGEDDTYSVPAWWRFRP
jgi:hypothetical protein